MQNCPACNSIRMASHRGPDEAVRYYNCLDCRNEVTTVEVPEPYLRELVDRSLELERLQRSVLAQTEAQRLQRAMQ